MDEREQKRATNAQTQQPLIPFASCATPRGIARGMIASVLLTGAASGLLVASCKPKTIAIELYFDTDIPRNRGMTFSIAARPGRPRGPLTAFDPAHDRFSFMRASSDGGVTLPGSVVITPGPMDGEVLVEVLVEVEFSSSSPAMSWTQYAVVQGSPGERNTVRMFLSQRCGSPARGCTTAPDVLCNVATICNERGLTCGEDGQCTRPEGWATFASAPAVCTNNMCGPGCSPCPAGTGCSDGGVCTPTPDGSVPCRDEDHDGFGVGFACVERDCNDRDRDTYPGAVELCDSKDNDCNGLIDDGACVMHTNTSCGAAQLLDLTTQMGTLVLHPDTTRGAFGANVTCAAVISSTGKELWYAVRYPQNEILEIRALASSNPYSHPVLFLQAACDQPQSLVCSQSTLVSNANARVILRPEPGAQPGPSTVYLLIDGYYPESNGPTRLELSHYAARASTCDEPFDVGIGGSIGAVAGSVDAFAASCVTGSFPDDVYRVGVSNLYAVAGVISSDSGAVLYDVCPAGRAMSCFNSLGARWVASAPVNVAIDGIRPGTRYIATFTNNCDRCQ